MKDKHNENDNKIKHLFIKRLAVFALTFCLIVGIVTVDRECSMTYGRDSTVGITLKKIDENTVDAVVMGKSYYIDTIEIKEQLDKIEENWNAITEKAGL